MKEYANSGIPNVGGNLDHGEMLFVFSYQPGLTREFNISSAIVWQVQSACIDIPVYLNLSSWCLRNT